MENTRTWTQSDEIDSKEKEEKKNTAALKLQRKQRLETLIDKRINNFLYLKKIHEGGCYWLNCVLFEKNDLNNCIQLKCPDNRSLTYYYLGLSVSSLLDITDGPPVIKALSQLMEEWEYAFSNAAIQGMKYVLARTSNGVYPQFTAVADDQDQIRSTVYKFDNDVIYQYLNFPHVPFELDYIEVLFSLCDMLQLLYKKLWHIDSYRYLYCILIYTSTYRLHTYIYLYFYTYVYDEMKLFISI